MHTKAVKGTYLLRCYASIRKRQHVASLSGDAGKCNVFVFSCTPDFYLIKLLENWEVPEICVNTQSLRASSTEYHLTVNRLAGFPFRIPPPFLRNSSDKKHTSPVTVAATERGLCAFRRYAEHGYAMPVCRRNVFPYMWMVTAFPHPPKRKISP